jgi:hypothetical protein
MIYRTRGEHTNHYATDEPMIYRTRGEHTNHYVTDEPMIYRTRGEHTNITSPMNPWLTCSRHDIAEKLMS